MDTVKDRVGRGAALLDDLGPDGWANRVSVDILDILSGLRCVLAQVYPSYWHAISFLDLNEEEQRRHGFDMPLGVPEAEFDRERNALNEAWGEEIDKRISD